jgi:hypothetical protein
MHLTCRVHIKKTEEQCYHLRHSHKLCARVEKADAPPVSYHAEIRTCSGIKNSSIYILQFLFNFVSCKSLINYHEMSTCIMCESSHNWVPFCSSYIISPVWWALGHVICSAYIHVYSYKIRTWKWSCRKVRY